MVDGWTLDKDGLLTIYLHDINVVSNNDFNKVNVGTWPWGSDSQSKDVKSIKILKSAPSTGSGSGVKVEGSLKHMFSSMTSLTSIEGLDNLQPVTNKKLDFSYLFSGDSSLKKLDLIKIKGRNLLILIRQMNAYYLVIVSLAC